MTGVPLLSATEIVQTVPVTSVVGASTVTLRRQSLLATSTAVGLIVTVPTGASCAVKGSAPWM